MYYMYMRLEQNLEFGVLLIKNGFKIVFKLDKFVLVKNGNFVGKGYSIGVKFKLKK